MFRIFEKRPMLRLIVLILMIAAAFAGGIVFSYFQFMPERKKPAPAVVVIGEELPDPTEAEVDAIGDFILHHEYFASDQDVLTENLEPAESADVSVQNADDAASDDEKASSEPERGQAPEEKLQTETSQQDKQRVILDKIQTSQPMIAVVIDDMGINQKRTEDILTLKAPLTSSFLTYGRRLSELAAKAKDAGHEVMIHAPMEPKISANLAPDTLLVSMNQEQIETLFAQMLAKFEDIHVSGINNHMGSRFTEDREKLGHVMAVLKQHGMFFLDSKTTAKSQGKSLAEEDGVDYAARDVFLDNENNYDYISGQLLKAEKIAQKKGFSIAICHPKSQTFPALKDWLETLKDKNLRLVHVSEIVQALNR